MSISQSTQFEIRKLTINYNDGKTVIDVRGMFEELSIFDNMLMPCMSGNILIRDAVGLASKINFDGSESIDIDIVKDIDSAGDVIGSNSSFSAFSRKFSIYKLTDRKAVNQNSELYTLHFVAPEFLLSEQKRVQKTYTDTHSNIIKKILTDELKIADSTPYMASIVPTKGIHSVPPTNRSPFDMINHLTKRAVSYEGKPDFVFWQAPYGYNFLPLSLLFTYDTQHTINFGVKNLSQVSNGKGYLDNEMLGARDYKVLSNFNYAHNIQSGVYAGKFIGFDTLTRTIKTNEVSYDDVFDKRANEYAINTKIKNADNKLATQMYDSRVTLYPFQSARTLNPYLKSNDVKSANIVDDTDNYILQRKMIFDNLMQKRIRITMPGNFGLYSGACVQLNIPHRYNVDTQNMENGDKSLSGKYIIIGVRHLIRYDKHETILEVATDSTNFKT